MLNYNAEELIHFSSAVMEKAGLEKDEAQCFAESLIFADLRGIASHGISRLKTYSHRVDCGVVTGGVEPEIISDHGALLHVDAKNAIGSVAAMRIMRLCMKRAETTGIALAAVKNATHFGTGAFFTKYAAKNKMVGIAISNSEAGVVPIGGAVAMLGTNPISIAIPAGTHEPLVLDMATSVAARGKVVQAKKEGRTIPIGWAVDENGVPTTDPDAALRGAMLPFGGPKGYGLSMIVDILCSCLAGALNGRETPGFWDDFEHPQNIGYIIGAIGVEHITPFPVFTDNVDRLFDEFKQCPAAPGTEEILIPGEPEDRQYNLRLKNGIPLSDKIVEELRTLAEKYQVSFPAPI